jgi:hypothetical protein
VRRSSFRRERDGSLSLRSLVKAKARDQMDSPPTSGSSLDSCPLRNQWTKARGLRRCGHGRKTTPLSSPTIRLWASKDELPTSPTTLVHNLSLPFLLLFLNNKLIDKCKLGLHLNAACTTTALAIMDVPYGLNRLKDPLQPHWDDEPFPPDQVVEAIHQLQHNNQNAKMVIILF